MESGKASKMLAHQYALTDPLHQIFDAIDAISVQGYDENRRVIYWNKGISGLNFFIFQFFYQVIS